MCSIELDQEEMMDKGEMQIIEELLTYLRPAINRWEAGDPIGYAELMTDNGTYFSTMIEAQIVGKDALIEFFRPMVDTWKIPRLQEANLQLHVVGRQRILSGHWIEFDEANQPMNTWCFSEFWTRIGEHWKIAHANWAIKAVSPPAD
jgi:hypothetical protein